MLAHEFVAKVTMAARGYAGRRAKFRIARARASAPWLVHLDGRCREARAAVARGDLEILYVWGADSRDFELNGAAEIIRG